MKNRTKPKLKELALLGLPILLIPIFAFLLGKPHGNGELSLVQTKIEPVPNRPADTQVDVVVKYGSPSRFPDFITPAPYGSTGWVMVDAQGKPVSFSALGGGEGPRGDYRYGFTYQFSKSELSKHKGRLTLKAIVVIDGKRLPVSVVVRKS
jgi:hypothetical protein